MSTPLEDFFVQFASLGFTYRRKNTAHNNFERLCRVSQWDEGAAELIGARGEFNDALVQQFNFIFGTGVDLESWQKFCSFIGITPIPDTIQDCQRLVGEVHVNIVDLLESARTGKQVRMFATLEDLRKYTIKQKKIFPRQSAYAGGLLRYLLREIKGPYRGRKRGGSKQRKRRKARKQALAAAATQSSGS